MYFYEVWVSSQNYHSNKPLTYSFDSQLQAGSIVAVPLQRQTIVGVISRKVAKPSFSTKGILSIIDPAPLPQQILELIAWLMNYYPGPSGQIVSLAVPTILAAKSRQTLSPSGSSSEAIPPPPLTDDQARAVKTIRNTFPA